MPRDQLGSGMEGYLDDSRARTLEEALADLLATHEKRPSAELARMIRQLEAEIADRKASRRDTMPRHIPET